MAKYQLDPFVPSFLEVAMTLFRCGDKCFTTYFMMVHLFPVQEDADAEGDWVVARIRSTPKEVARKLGASYRWFREKTWPSLIEAGLVVEEEPGVIFLPKYKKKKDLYVIPSHVDKRLQDYEERIEQYEERMERMENMIERLVKIIDGFYENARKNDQNMPAGGSGLLSEGRPLPLRGEATTSGSGRDILINVLKEKKRSLSHAKVVSGFYKGIGQNRISKQKRERASSVSKKLEKDGFSLEDIAFAIDWTLDNAKEELYDFSILEHTIGQAIADRDKRAQNAQEEADREMAEAKQKADQEQKERDREIVEAYKANLSEEERDKLYDQAEEEIRKAGDYKESFIDSFIVGLKENEIVRKLLAEEGRVERDDD